GLDDRWCPTLRQLRAELLNLQAQIKRPGPANPSRTEWTVGRVQRFVTVRDYGALCVLFGALTGGMHPQDEADDDDGLDDDGLDDDGLDDDDDDDLDDDDTDDDGLDDDEHGADCFCGACCEAQLVGLATVAGDDPDAYLARSGAGDLATVGREVLDDEGLDEDSLDFNPCPRPPDCDWCGGKGCDTCSDPNYAGVDP
ncbi:hypothetical protein L6R53_33545, partial [Myxococcota bacterium]|nr:hypothetical protein [Myxococcota bacterium]